MSDEKKTGWDKFIVGLASAAVLTCLFAVMSAKFGLKLAKEARVAAIACMLKYQDAELCAKCRGGDE
jgi:hypothetical protein